jgi:hypothetical protein
MMDLVTASPAEIDAKLAVLWTELYALVDQRDGRAGQLDEQRRPVVLARIEELRQAVKPLECQWTQRRWNRYFQTDRSDGHIHRFRHCSTCGPRTRMQWLIDWAGKTEQQMMTELGQDAWRLCTVCFPDAPVLPKPVVEGKCDGQPASGQGTRINKKCDKCAHVGKARNWRRHNPK